MAVRWGNSARVNRGGSKSPMGRVKFSRNELRVFSQGKKKGMPCPSQCTKKSEIGGKKTRPLKQTGRPRVFHIANERSNASGKKGGHQRAEVFKKNWLVNEKMGDRSGAKHDDLNPSA